MSRVAILQSNYLPWRGYFDMIAKVDEFIVYDSCQYTVNDWRNRNQVKGRDGLIWLTVPVLTKGRTGQLITDAAFAETNWATKHLATIRQTLGRAPHVGSVDELLATTLEASIGTGRLHEVNVASWTANAAHVWQSSPAEPAPPRTSPDRGVSTTWTRPPSTNVASPSR
jgi:hypothetical protein